MEKKNEFQPTNEQLKSLTTKEKSFWKIMSSNSGVLYVVGQPGVGKTQTLRSLASKLDLNVIDLRLTTMDETELGLFPKVVNVQGQDVVKFLPPYWVLDAMSKPSIIILEEFNRASKYVTNAAMKLLSEREIGDIKLPDNVFLCATGNLGEEDNCDVEILDAAKKNRFITSKYEVNLQSWIDDFANDNVHPLIIEFLKSNVGYFYPENQTDEYVLINPRSWTNLSNYIVKNYGMSSKFSDFKEDLIEFGMSYIGNANAKLITYLTDKENLKFDDIINNDDKLKIFISLGRDAKYSYLDELTYKVLDDFNETQLNRIIEMLKSVDKDVLVSILTTLVKKTPTDKIKNSVIKTVINKNFSDIKEYIIKKTEEV